MFTTLTRFLTTTGLTALACTAIAEEGRGPSLTSVGGEISRIESQAVTIVSRKDSGSSEKTVTVNAGTKIQLERDQTETVGEGGKTRRLVADGTLADLAVGQRVRAEAQADGSAVRILVLHVTPKPAGGEGSK